MVRLVRGIPRAPLPWARRAARAVWAAALLATVLLASMLFGARPLSAAEADPALAPDGSDAAASTVWEPLDPYGAPAGDGSCQQAGCCADCGCGGGSCLHWGRSAYGGHGCGCQCGACCPEPWHWQLLPDGLIYRSYLAGVKESRFGSVWFNEREQGMLWDVALGGRVGLLRLGTSGGEFVEGWQLDIEGAAFPRLDPEDERDLVSSDFRFGIPLTYGEGPYQTKFAYYHLSSHLGDEFMLKNPNVPRVNYTRDALVWGQSYYVNQDLRLYGELEYAFYTQGGAEPWAVQFGAEYSPACDTGLYGAPFAAVNAYLFEEEDYGGIFTVQSGWQWRGGCTGKLLRVGFHFLTGKSPQFEFFGQHETQIGGGIWYDY